MSSMVIIGTRMDGVTNTIPKDLVDQDKCFYLVAVVVAVLIYLNITLAQNFAMK